MKIPNMPDANVPYYLHQVKDEDLFDQLMCAINNNPPFQSTAPSPSSDKVKATKNKRRVSRERRERDDQ